MKVCVNKTPTTFAGIYQALDTLWLLEKHNRNLLLVR